MDFFPRSIQQKHLLERLICIASCQPFFTFVGKITKQAFACWSWLLVSQSFRWTFQAQIELFISTWITFFHAPYEHKRRTDSPVASAWDSRRKIQSILVSQLECNLNFNVNICTSQRSEKTKFCRILPRCLCLRFEGYINLCIAWMLKRVLFRINGVAIFEVENSEYNFVKLISISLFISVWTRL